MSITTRLQGGFKNLLDNAGQIIRIRYFDEVIDPVYDDDVSLTISSDVWTSGIVLPIRAKEGSSEAVLVQQGLLIDGDVKVFVSGTINLTGTGSIIKLGIGSPTSTEYSLLPLGVLSPQVGNTIIYKKCYFRRLTNGSLIGEE